MIKKLMMLCVAAMAAMGAWATGEKSVVLGDWYEALSDNVATTCARWHDFWMGSNVAIPVIGLASPILASDVVVTAGTYSEFGRPYVLTEAEMWNRYGAPVLREKNLGNLGFDRYDNVWQNWKAEEDGAYGYELSADIWPNWSQVSGRQWILIPTGVPRLGTHTFSVKINGVEHNNYVVSFVMAEDQEPEPYGCQVTFNPKGGEVVEDNREVVVGKSIGTLPTPTRSKYKFLGWYTAPEGGTKISATTKVTGDVTYYAQWVYDGSATISVVVADGCEVMGKVTGGKTAKAGTKLTLKATANKGHVFAGWYEDEGFTMPCDSTLIDYRNPSYAYMMGANDKTFYARFEPVAADTNLNLTVGGVAITPEDTPLKSFTVGSATNLPLVIDSLSLPKAAVKGLPAGMKFTDKPVYKKGSKTEIEVPANTIYGTPTKPGVYKVSVKLANTTIKKAIEKKFTIEVPNFTAANGYFVDNLDNGIGKKRVLSVGITNIDDFLPSLALNSGTAKLAVSGLPAGLKYDAANGRITGIATKAGTYTITFTVTDGKAKYVSTITIEVEALPDWVVGTFEGYFNEHGWYSYSNYNKGYGSDWEAIGHFAVSITTTGKVTGKFVKAHETQSFTAALVNVGQDRYEFFADYAAKDGNGWDERGELSFAVVYDEYENTHCARIAGELLGAENDNQDMPFEREIYGWRNLWSVKDIPLPKIAKATTYSKWYADEEYDIYGTLSLSFSAGRNTVVSSFAFDDLEDQKTLKITKCTSQLIVTGYDEASGVFSAFLPIYMKHLDKPGDDEWIDLDFLMPIQIDTEGNVNIIWADVKCAHDDWW